MRLIDYFLEHEKLRTEYADDAALATEISVHSKTKVQWRCENGHEWEASADARVRGGNNCPYCANQRIIPGENDFQTKHPDKAALWHPTKNGALTPDTVAPGSVRKVWWQCESGHEWEACVYAVARAVGSGCPYCRSLKAIPGETDIATTHPEAVLLWDYEKNPKLSPRTVTANSKTKVWWKCDSGHSWQAQVASVVVGGTRCPYCTGHRAIPGETDLVTLYPEIAARWDYDKNGSLDPCTVSPFSHDKVWWKCDLGHSWQAMPFSRTRPKGSGCPYCTGRKVLPGFNDLATLKPALAEEWYQPLNDDLQPTDVSLGSNKKVWWRCGKHHVWQAFIYARTKSNGTGCPVCTGVAKARKIPFFVEPTKPQTHIKTPTRTATQASL